MKGPKPYRESNCKTTSFADKKRNKEKQKCKTISTTSFLVCSPLFVWSLPFNLFGTGGPTRNTRLQPT